MSSYNSELYQQVILDHNKNPRNFKALENPTCMCEGHNPLCGDQITVFINLDGPVIKEITFTGVGCAICKASASMMTAFIKGKPKEEAELLFHEFHKMVKGELNVNSEAHHLGRLAIFSNVSHFPVRVKCASLPWHAMHSALEQKGSASTE